MPERKSTDATLIDTNGVYYRVWDGGRGAFRVGPHSGTGTLTLSLLNVTFTTLDTVADYTSMGSELTFTAAGNAQFFAPAGAVLGVVVTLASSLATNFSIEPAGH